MIANRTNQISTFPIPITTNTKWWKEVDVNEAFKKGNNFRINAGASCGGGAIIDDKKGNKDSNKTTTDKGSKKKDAPLKGSKKNYKKNDKK